MTTEIRELTDEKLIAGFNEQKQFINCQGSAHKYDFKVFDAYVAELELRNLLKGLVA